MTQKTNIINELEADFEYSEFEKWMDGEWKNLKDSFLAELSKGIKFN